MIKRSVVLDTLLPEYFDLFRDTEYSGVELNIKSIYELPVSEVLSLKKNYGLDIVAFGTGRHFVDDGISLSHSDESVRFQAVEILKKYIDFAKKTNSLVIIGLIRGNLTAKKDFKNFVDSLKSVVDYADSQEVILVLEPINHYETNFLNTVSETVEVVEKIKSEFLGVLVDTFHMNIEESESSSEIIRKFSSYIKHVHFAEACRVVPGIMKGKFLMDNFTESFFPWEKYACDRKKVEPLIQRTIDFQSIVKVLKEINYKGFISLEVLEVPSKKEVILQGDKFFKKIFAGE